MKSLKIALGISMAVVGAGSVVTVAALNKNGKLFETQAQQVVDFTNTSITRRIWFVDNDPGWWQVDANRRIYVEAFQKSDESHNTGGIIGTKLISDYSGGLFYADVTFVGAGDEIGVILRWGDTNGVYGWGNNNQTGTMTLPSLQSKTYDVINLNNGTWWDGTWSRNSRNAEISDAALMETAQMTYLLQNYQTCDDSYTTGYNAYPQFYANFYQYNTKITDTTSFDDYDYDEYIDAGKNYAGLTQKTPTTITAKVSKMQSMYDTYGWTVE